jgi:diaminopimelate epimerase
MGEVTFVQSHTSQACQQTIEQYERVVDETLRVQTPGGVFEIQWSSEGKATAMGQLAFFAELKLFRQMGLPELAPARAV